MDRRPLRIGSTFALVALAAAALSLGAGGSAPAKSDKAAASPAADKALLARGEYLANTMGCGDCHTPGTLFGSPNLEHRFAGSEVGWHGPWGTSFARNITPDLETGIGYWSREELVSSFRTGIKNDGKPFLPPMPWPDLALLTDADRNALAAYLLSVPAVAHKVPDALPPGQAYSGPVIEIPAPGAWDAPAPAASPAPATPPAAGAKK